MFMLSPLVLIDSINDQLIVVVEGSGLRLGEYNVSQDDVRGRERLLQNPRMERDPVSRIMLESVELLKH